MLSPFFLLTFEGDNFLKLLDIRIKALQNQDYNMPDFGLHTTMQGRTHREFIQFSVLVKHYRTFCLYTETNIQTRKNKDAIRGLCFCDNNANCQKQNYLQIHKPLMKNIVQQVM